MPTHEWTFHGQPVEVDYTLHKAVPETSDTPGIGAFVEIYHIRRNGSAISDHEWDQFMDEEFEPFHIYAIGKERKMKKWEESDGET